MMQMNLLFRRFLPVLFAIAVSSLGFAQENMLTKQGNFVVGCNYWARMQVRKCGVTGYLKLLRTISNSYRKTEFL
jgi:hypothetical protein